GFITVALRARCRGARRATAIEPRASLRARGRGTGERRLRHGRGHHRRGRAGIWPVVPLPGFPDRRPRPVPAEVGVAPLPVALQLALAVLDSPPLMAGAGVPAVLAGGAVLLVAQAPVGLRPGVIGLLPALFLLGGVDGLRHLMARDGPQEAADRHPHGG